MVEDYVRVSADDLRDEELRSVKVNGQDVCLVKAGGRLYALTDTCTHAACSLAESGEVDGDEIECTCHGSRFKLATGAVASPPASQPLKSLDVRVDAGQVLVRPA